MLRDPYIVWTMPLIMLMIILLQSVSRPDMPHIDWPVLHYQRVPPIYVGNILPY